MRGLEQGQRYLITSNGAPVGDLAPRHRRHFTRRAAHDAEDGDEDGDGRVSGSTLPRVAMPHSRGLLDTSAVIELDERAREFSATLGWPSVPTPDGWADRPADADLSTVEQHSGTVAIVFRFCSFKPECGARQHEVCFSGVPGFLTPPSSVVEVLLGRSHHASLHGSTVSRPSPSKSVVFLVARAAPLVMQIAAIIPSSTASGRPVRRRVSCRSAYRRAAESS